MPEGWRTHDPVHPPGVPSLALGSSPTRGRGNVSKRGSSSPPSCSASPSTLVVKEKGHCPRSRPLRTLGPPTQTRPPPALKEGTDSSSLPSGTLLLRKFPRDPSDLRIRLQVRVAPTGTPPSLLFLPRNRPWTRLNCGSPIELSPFGPGHGCLRYVP